LPHSSPTHYDPPPNILPSGGNISRNKVLIQRRQQRQQRHREVMLRRSKRSSPCWRLGRDTSTDKVDLRDTVYLLWRFRSKSLPAQRKAISRSHSEKEYVTCHICPAGHMLIYHLSKHYALDFSPVTLTDSDQNGLSW
jgi:hypothetical protein